MQNKTRPQWDTVHSSYFWIITLNPNYHGARPNTTDKLTGYSKRVGESENQDPDALLKRKIINLYTNSYLDRCTKIEIFTRVGFVINKATDPRLMTLYPTYYDIDELNHASVLKRFGVFLKAFYDEKTKVTPDFKKLLPGSRQMKSKDDFLNPDKYNFTNPAQLYGHASRLLTHGHAPGEVDHFIREYKTRKKW